MCATRATQLSDNRHRLVINGKNSHREQFWEHCYAYHTVILDVRILAELITKVFIKGTPSRNTSLTWTNMTFNGMFVCKREADSQLKGSRPNCLKAHDYRRH